MLKLTDEHKLSEHYKVYEENPENRSNHAART